MIDPEQHVDVLIIGAGLSGIGAAWRLQESCPGRSYTILEARDAVGGTWDLFRYPGIRSDSDMYTFSYPFRPWRGARSLADGASIRDYIARTAVEGGIDRHIRFGTRVVSAAWSSDEARWTVDARSGPGDAIVRYTCSWLHACAGYYDHAHGYQPRFEALADFRGTFVHPQAWPKDLDWSGRRVVVIGSGATAVTLVPELAVTAEHVTMLQRSATYVTSLPAADRVADALRRRLPPMAAHRVLRARNVVLSQGFYQLCRRRPALARRLIRAGMEQHIADPALLDAHFTPTYEPWDQRLCVMPDGDLLRTIAAARADVVTDRIERFVPEGIRLASGRVLAADLVVSATGLSLLPMGGVAVSVDGRPVDVPETLAYRGLMLSGVPNLAYCIGYTNASWTLRADLVSQYLCRLLNHMERNGIASMTPVAPGEQVGRPLLDMTSGYIQRGAHLFPHQGRHEPWTVGQNYLVDRWRMPRADLTEDMRVVTWAELAARRRGGTVAAGGRVPTAGPVPAGDPVPSAAPRREPRRL